MLLGSLLQLPLPVLVIPSSSIALLLGPWVGLPPGEWVGLVSVPCCIDQLPLLFVVQVMPLQLDLVENLE